MNTKTIISALYNGHRFQLIKVSYSSGFVTYSILQDRRVVRSNMIGRVSSLFEFAHMLRMKIINGEIA